VNDRKHVSVWTVSDAQASVRKLTDRKLDLYSIHHYVQSVRYATNRNNWLLLNEFTFKQMNYFALRCSPNVSVILSK
jgi:hypothetical protein